jgi:hypothetical protein
LRGRFALPLLLALLLAAPAHAATRDDTAWLQARLDAGGSVFLPKLAGGECYATRGLWITKDDTQITSDGACITALGPGEARLTDAPQPVIANAVFFISHDSIFRSQPVRVRIGGLTIHVPRTADVAGIAVFGHETSIDSVVVDGAPTNDVSVGSALAGATERVSVLRSTLRGGRRNDLVAVATIGLRVEGSTFAGGDGNGLVVRAGARGMPALDADVTDNTVSGNRGAGVLVDLEPVDGLPVLADEIRFEHNDITGNASAAAPQLRAGIVVRGGQRDGAGVVTFVGNQVHGNAGAALLERDLRARIASSENTFAGGVIRTGRASAERTPRRWTPSSAQLAAAGRDDTAWLQARLDDGSSVFLPKLPGGRCYATRGLWVSHDDVSITSDGACIVSLGPGEARLRSTDGDSIAATAVFFVNRSDHTKPAPAGVTISGLRIVVPGGQGMSGVAVSGHDVTLSRLDVEGAPFDDVSIGGRANGTGYAADISVLDSTLTGAGRNAISAYGVIGLSVERNVVSGVRDDPAGMPAAGIDVEPDERSQPTLDVRIVGNTFTDNAGPGILVSLDSNSGPAVLADALDVSDNVVERNSTSGEPTLRGGIVLSGGEDGGAGTLLLSGNTIHDNGGPGLLRRFLALVVTDSGNDFSGNEDGAVVDAAG